MQVPREWFQTLSSGAQRTRSSGHKLKHKKFHLNMRNFFPFRVVKLWNSFPESSPLEAPKTHLGVTPCHLLLVTLLCQGVWTE